MSAADEPDDGFDTEPDDAVADAAETPGRGGRTPAATFEFLVHTLFTQALMALGRVPNPITGKSLRNLETARHFIDTLGMLELKTAGNLTAEERQLLEEMQHQLRMMYVAEKGGPR